MLVRFLKVPSESFGGSKLLAHDVTVLSRLRELEVCRVLDMGLYFSSGVSP